MTLEWIDPPRNWQDSADDLIAELHANPGRWARVASNIGGLARSYTDHLRSAGIEWCAEPIEHDGNGGVGRLDLYARAPKGAE